MSVDPTELVVMFLAFLAGSHGDLLDSMSTEQYWQARHLQVTTEQLREDASAAPAAANIDRFLHDLASDDFRTRVKSREALAGMGPGIIGRLKPALASKDPEVSETVSGLITELSKQTHQRDVERLMAIRTLGERKDAGSLAMLEKMEQEKDVFVAAYARRAVAEIQGQGWAWPEQHAAVAGEAWLLPADTAMVLQGTQAGWAGLTVDRFAAMAQGSAATTDAGTDAALAQP
ncbi:MAG TPA: hypothetical protein VHQ47_19705, partial [Phycisphaerae bacterium]|nr:hypothetical protein [Phycisphaerae bacterium]